MIFHSYVSLPEGTYSEFMGWKDPKEKSARLPPTSPHVATKARWVWCPRKSEALDDPAGHHGYTDCWPDLRGLGFHVPGIEKNGGNIWKQPGWIPLHGFEGCIHHHPPQLPWHSCPVFPRCFMNFTISSVPAFFPDTPSLIDHTASRLCRRWRVARRWRRWRRWLMAPGLKTAWNLGFTHYSMVICPFSMEMCLVLLAKKLCKWAVFSMANSDITGWYISILTPLYHHCITITSH